MPEHEFRNLIAGLRRLGFAKYAEYTESDAWARRRAAHTLDHIYICVRCYAYDKRLQLHHRTYARLGAEVEGDLCWLCDDCHAVLHDLGELDPLNVPVIADGAYASIEAATERASARARRWVAR